MIRNQNKAKFITYLTELRLNHYHETVDKQKEIIRNEFNNMGAFVRKAFKSNLKTSKTKENKRIKNLTKLFKNNLEDMIENIYKTTANDDLLNKDK